VTAQVYEFRTVPRASHTKTGTQVARPLYGDYSLVVTDELDDEYYQLLQYKLRDYNRRNAPHMEPPEAIPLNIRVVDEKERTIGGMAALTYWGWLVIKLLVLDDSQRGNGIGQRLLHLAHEEARRRGCTRAHTMTYDFQALKFYEKYGYRIVGELADYPEGYCYYWLRKDLDTDDGAVDEIAGLAGPDHSFGSNGL
jgi:N-acylglucosamine-6-phosphate 2-epimerase